ncbi:MAG: site-specific integrase, partial [Prolixibacteraceae bacterium]|nr:site-specific integrase [Prolixibacteraceae bacterium]
MAAKIKFFTRITNQNNEANIRVRFSNGRQFDLTAVTNFQINPEYWNNEKGIVRQRAEFENKYELQKSLNSLQSFIQSEYDNTPDKSKINKDWLSETIDKNFNPDKYLQDNLNLFGFIQHFINNSSKRVNPDTGNPVCYKMRREYEVTFNYLKEYAKEYSEPDFIDIDLEFYQQFVDFLRGKGLAVNTIGKKIQTLKIFLNTATEQGINQYMKYKSRKFKALSEESDSIYLTKKELTQFYEFDFSNRPGLERIRDLFIIAAWTGVRYSDIQQIRPERIIDNIFTMKQQKTVKKSVIPINRIVWNIIDKYNGELPKPISNQKFNEYLKEAAKIAKLNSIFVKTVSEHGMRIEKKYSKHEVIGSHTA